MSPLRFLIIDDAAFIRDLLKKNLRNCFPGCTIIDVNSATKAQATLKTQAFDLILCDWEMPEMSGEEFLRWVRSSDHYKHIPFIMVTSRSEKDFIIKAIQAGVNDYIGKPFTPETLQTHIVRTLKKAGIAIPGIGSRSTANQGLANSSLSVLTSGSATTATPLINKPAEEAPTAPTKKTTHGQAQINFSNGKIGQSLIRDISLQRMTCIIKRDEPLPQILDNVVVSIVDNDSTNVARLNAYIHSITALENSINANTFQLSLRFVDDDPEKLDLLSRYIAKL